MYITISKLIGNIRQFNAGFTKLLNPREPFVNLLPTKGEREHLKEKN